MENSTGFSTFYSNVCDYLMHINDKRARQFGIRFAEYLQTKHRGLDPRARPKLESPTHRLVQMEVERIFREHYGIVAPEGLESRSGRP
jgi:hypothetical protein